MHGYIEILRNSILITGMVVVMMMMIESLNIESKGLVFKGLRKTKFGQVVIATLLGSIPGCMGGFATVSLYTHRMFSFGALVAMMIASSGDEAFVMLAMIPEQALLIFAVLFVLAIIVGVITDKVWDICHKKHCQKDDHDDCGAEVACSDGYAVHNHEGNETTHEHGSKRRFGWKRILMFAGLALFIAALATGQLGHDHATHEHTCIHGHHHHAAEGLTINLLSEDWMNVLFAGLSLIMLFVLLLGSNHFVEVHIWNHIIKKHLPVIFAWTFGTLLVIGIGSHVINIEHWISAKENIALLILIAALVGFIPESGPHLIFVTLVAEYPALMPVLLASCISQDGHASIPLLAESKKSFAIAKLINCFVALAAGYAAMLFM